MEREHRPPEASSLVELDDLLITKASFWQLFKANLKIKPVSYDVVFRVQEKPIKNTKVVSSLSY